MRVWKLLMERQQKSRRVPTITPTPAAWQVEIMLANWERLPRFEVSV